MRKILLTILGPMFLAEKDKEIAQRDSEIQLLKDACLQLNESLKFEIARRMPQPIQPENEHYLAGYRKGLTHKLEFIPKPPEPTAKLPKKKKRRK